MSKSRVDKDIEIPDSILKQLLTSSEIRMIKNRYQILNLLKEGLSIRNIASQIKVGTDTVVRVSKIWGKNNLNISKKTKKIAIKISTPWVFGKSS